MSEYLGRNIAVGIAKEAVRGTAETTPDYWVRLLAQNHKDKADYLSSQAAIGTIVETNSAEIDKQWSEGGFDAEIDVDSMGLLFLALFGGDTPTEVDAPDAYLHTFDLEESVNHQSLTLFTSEPGRDEAYPLSCMDSLSFNFERGKILDFSTNLMGQAGESSTLTPAFTTPKAFRPKDFHLYLADDIDGLDAADEVFLKTMTLEFNKNLEPDDVLGLESPQNFLNKVFKTGGKFSLFYTDDTYRSLFKAGTPKALRVELLNPSVELVAAIAATGSLTSDNTNVADGATVTIGAKTYTFNTVLVNSANRILIGSDADDSLANLKLAMTAGSGVGVKYGTGTTASTEVTPGVIASYILPLTAITAGVAGNSLATTETSTHLSFGGATLSGGAEAINPYIVFDFARVYFSGYEEGNGRDDVKKQDITLTFAMNTEEAEIVFGQIRVLNAVATY